MSADELVAEAQHAQDTVPVELLLDAGLTPDVIASLKKHGAPRVGHRRRER